ncbi:hypothetical protein JXI42_09620 [bacterium]|nr:hypothetical protein [bacterium]
MTVLEKVAKELKIPPEELLKESLQNYLKRKLKLVETELYVLSKKYGVKNVNDFDQAISNGKFHEENSYEDYFRFDNLEAERDSILASLKEVK